MRARAFALPAFEIAVRGRGDPFLRTAEVAVHPHAHRAACVPPLEAGVAEHRVEAFGLGLLLHLPGSRYHHRRDARLAPTHHGRRGSKILDAAVGAGADEDTTPPQAFQTRAGRAPLILRAPPPRARR